MSLTHPNPQRIVRAYYVVQGAAVLGWWVLLATVEPAREWFVPEGDAPNELLRFWLPDIGLLGAGSWFVAWAVARQGSWSRAAAWWLAGAACYAGLFTLGASLRTDGGWLASACTATMTGLCLVAASMLGAPGEKLAAYRPVRMRGGSALAWTLLQIAIFWGLFLWILPKGVLELEQRLGLPRIPSGGPYALALFAAASLLGLASGITMARVGQGTPLPTATASGLVVAGPYRFVRNPMAVAGIAQGVAIAWYLGSATYGMLSLIGGIFWHLLVRPSEETDLEARFGQPYRDYKAKVGLWLPWTFRDRRESEKPVA